MQQDTRQMPVAKIKASVSQDRWKEGAKQNRPIFVDHTEKITEIYSFRLYQQPRKLTEPSYLSF